MIIFETLSLEVVRICHSVASENAGPIGPGATLSLDRGNCTLFSASFPQGVAQMRQPFALTHARAR